MRGRTQAAALAQAIRSEYQPIRAVYSSDAVRSYETARQISSAVTALADLAEIHIGSMEGASDAAALTRTAETLRSWVVDGDWSARVGDGESGSEVAGRMARALSEIATPHREETVVVIGHVGSLTAGLASLCPDLQPWGAPLPHGVPFLVEFDGTWRCEWPRCGWPSSRTTA